MVVIHGPRELDPVAIDLARSERILLAISGSPTEEALVSALTDLKASTAT
jgi:predicted transcriptional regulator